MVSSSHDPLPLIQSLFDKCDHVREFCFVAVLSVLQQEARSELWSVSVVSCFQFVPDEPGVRMVSYKRLNPEDVHLSCPGLAKEPSVVGEGFPVSPFVAPQASETPECGPGCAYVTVE